MTTSAETVLVTFTEGILMGNFIFCVVLRATFINNTVVGVFSVSRVDGHIGQSSNLEKL